MAATTFSVTSYALICGCKSYVATSGDGTKIRSAPSSSLSIPPSKSTLHAHIFPFPQFSIVLTHDLQ